MKKMTLLVSKIILISSIASTNTFAASTGGMNAATSSKTDMTSQSHQSENFDTLDIYAEDYSLIFQTEEEQTTSTTSKSEDYPLNHDISDIYDEDYSPLL